MQIEAIILKKQFTREHDQLVTCYTREMGKLTAVAKSALKHTSKQAMQLDVLNKTQFELVEGKSMPIITGAQLEDGYRRTKTSLPSMGMAYFFLEIIDRMVFDHQQDERLWDFLEQTLRELNEGERTLSWFRRHQLELLDTLGYMPQASSCSLCQSGDCTERAALYMEVGGLICEQCFMRVGRGILLVHDDINLLQGTQELHGLTDVQGPSIIDAIFEYTFGTRFSSLGFLYSMEGFRGILS